jgi:membrane-associated PAP2 superfamily phosphatase
MADRLYTQLVFAFLITLIVAQATFAAFPGIDLAVSAAFADGTAGFPLAGRAPSTLNAIVKTLGESLLAVLIIWWLLGVATGHLRDDSLTAWGIVPLTAILASGWIVNLVLKANVGRARPAEIAQFGGDAIFTPAWQVTDQCARNCAFTSGEVSLAASLAIPAVVLLWPRLHRPWARIGAIAAALAYVGGVSLLRIGLGRHFLSDAVFSILITVAVLLVLYPMLGIGRVRAALDPRLPFVVGHRLIAPHRARALAWLRSAPP